MGTRQTKFHQMLDDKLGEPLEKYPGKVNLPVYHVRTMKSARSTFTNKRIQLLKAEKWLSTRKFLWLVPLIFSLAYLACIVVAFLYGFQT